MGFLDHSTNNIIVDAVLTDIGRRKLARNDGSFSVVKFALGDDEIDYTIVRKYGLTVGREKIEKNTPIFEAQTSANLALKNKLVSLSSQVQSAMPILQRSAPAGTGILTISSLNNRTSDVIRFTQRMGSTGAGGNIPAELSEAVYVIRASTRFLQVQDQQGTPIAPVYTTERDKMGVYRMVNNGASGVSFRLAWNSSVNASTFATFGSNSKIHTVVTVTGLLSGVKAYLQVDLQNNQ